MNVCICKVGTVPLITSLSPAMRHVFCLLPKNSVSQPLTNMTKITFGKRCVAHYIVSIGYAFIRINKHALF